MAELSFSPDGSKIIFGKLQGLLVKKNRKNIKDLLSKGLVQPTNMELFICNFVDLNLDNLLLGNANWSPFFHPSGNKVLFSSNYNSEQGFPFNIYSIDIDGKNLKQVTFGEMFDSFPVFQIMANIFCFLQTEIMEEQEILIFSC